jgi:hypothetical protein
VQKFNTPELVRFLGEVDAALTRKARVVLIGGAVLALVYHSKRATSDIDVIEAEQAFWAAYERARASSAQPIPIQRVGIASPPYHYEDRLERLRLTGLKRLTVFVPERHDLALLKLARGYAHDLDGVADIHATAPLDLKVLIERYEETRVQVIGSPRMLRMSFLSLVARLWGEDEANALDKELE